MNSPLTADHQTPQEILPIPTIEADSPDKDYRDYAAIYWVDEL